MQIYIGKSHFSGTHYLFLNISKSRKYHYNDTKEGKNRALRLIYTQLNILTSFDERSGRHLWCPAKQPRPFGLMYIIFLRGD